MPLSLPLPLERESRRGSSAPRPRLGSHFPATPVHSRYSRPLPNVTLQAHMNEFRFSNKPAFHHFTVDVEEYFQVSALEPYAPRGRWDQFPRRLEVGLR